MISVPLDKNKHHRNRFDCGIDAVNNYLRLMANQQTSKDNSRTFVLEDKNNPEHIIGCYALMMTQLDLKVLPIKLQKKHKNTHSAGLIAHLAVDKRYFRHGFGEWLLIDALTKLLNASDTVAFPLIVVDAKDEAVQFYEKFGFTAFLNLPNKLFITLTNVRKNLE